MKQRFAILMVLLFFCCCQLTAQLQTPTRSFDIRVGLGYGQAKENTAYRLIYSGLNIPLDLRYKYSWDVHQFHIGLGGYFSRSKSRFEDKALWVNYNAHIGYNRVVISNQNWNLRVGGEIPFQTTINFFEDVQAEYFYWTTTASFNPTLQLEKHFQNNKKGYVAASFPVAGFYSRPPLQRFTNAEGNFGYIVSESNKDHQFFIIPQHLQFEFQGGYRYQLKNKMEQTISYHLLYLRNPNPLPTNMIIHQINLTTTLNWKKS